MYDMSFEEWAECEEYYNEIDEIIDAEMSEIAEIELMTDDEFLDWLEERNYEAFEEIVDLYDTLEYNY